MNLTRHILTACVLLGAAGFAPHVRAATDPCKLKISGNDLMQYDTQELSAPASCKEITLTLQHSGKLPKEAMGHDWVLVNAADVAAVANAGMSAGAASGYLAPGDKRVLAHTAVIGGGETTSVSFPATLLKAGGNYQYLCTFPGHSALMHGTFKFG